jgi:hypothetical protein
MIRHSPEVLLDNIKHITDKNLFEKETSILEGEIHWIGQGHRPEEFDRYLSSEAICPMQ